MNNVPTVNARQMEQARLTLVGLSVLTYLTLKALGAIGRLADRMAPGVVTFAGRVAESKPGTGSSAQLRP